VLSCRRAGVAMTRRHASHATAADLARAMTRHFIDTLQT
jgi:hypothetical protein